MTMWQPIETAPRNQTFLAVLNCAGKQTICTMRWPVAEVKNSRPDSKTFHVERVTHWMPLPDLPGAEAQPATNMPKLHVGNLPSINQDAYPALGAWWVQLWDGDHVFARVYGSTPEEAHSRAVTLAAAPKLEGKS
jgi:hypothetical protein